MVKLLKADLCRILLRLLTIISIDKAIRSVNIHSVRKASVIIRAYSMRVYDRNGTFRYQEIDRNAVPRDRICNLHPL